MAQHLVAVAVDDGEDLMATVSPRFGRCARFLLVDVEQRSVISSWQNSGTQAMQGAGVSSANEVAKHGVRAAFAGEFGPHAQRALEELQVRPVRVEPGTRVNSAIERYAESE